RRTRARRDPAAQRHHRAAPRGTAARDRAGVRRGSGHGGRGGGRHSLPCRTAYRSEDRSVPRPAREPRPRGGAHRRGPGARSLHLPRLVRPPRRSARRRGGGGGLERRCVGAGRENATLNEITNITWREANAFDLLRDLERREELFDTIVLDPPAFAKAKQSVPRAIAGYKEINLRAMRLVAPGGVLFTCSCSYHVSRVVF